MDIEKLPPESWDKKKMYRTPGGEILMIYEEGRWQQYTKNESIPFFNKKIWIEGKLLGRRVKELFTTPISNGVTVMDGNKLDELYLSAFLKTKEDAEQLIDLLKVHKHCLP